MLRRLFQKFVYNAIMYTNSLTRKLVREYHVPTIKARKTCAMYEGIMYTSERRQHIFIYGKRPEAPPPIIRTRKNSLKAHTHTRIALPMFFLFLSLKGRARKKYGQKLASAQGAAINRPSYRVKNLPGYLLPDRLDAFFSLFSPPPSPHPHPPFVEKGFA